MNALEVDSSRARSKKNMKQSNVDEEKVETGVETHARGGKWGGLRRFLEQRGDRVELRGAVPIAYADRTKTNYFSLFTLWFCVDCNPLSVTVGIVATTSYGLSLRGASLVILFFTMLATAPVAYMCTWGPKTGMRQLIQARFSFGRYFVSVPILFNLATLTGYCIVNSIVGGTTLSAVTDGETVSSTVGIVIICVLALVISFGGFQVLHWYERWASIPALISLVIAAGCGGKHLGEQVEAPPPSATRILTFGALVASFMLPWAVLASDYSTYMHPKAPSFRIALYTFLGLAVPTTLLMILGAAIGGAIPNVPEWQAGYDSNAAGGVLSAMLRPAGGFGRFVTVVIAFSVLGNIAATMYSITLNLQMIIPWLIRVPRGIFSIIITAIIIGVALEAVKSFFTNLNNFVGIVGYWSAVFIGIVLTEHMVFRHCRFTAETEDETAWDDAKKVPPGFAAMGTGVLCFCLVVPSMDQIWFTGPIAKKTGDIGFEIALVLSPVLYIPLRYLERRMCGR